MDELKIQTQVNRRRLQSYSHRDLWTFSELWDRYHSVNWFLYNSLDQTWQLLVHYQNTWVSNSLVSLILHSGGSCNILSCAYINPIKILQLIDWWIHSTCLKIFSVSMFFCVPEGNSGDNRTSSKSTNDNYFTQCKISRISGV